MANATVTVLEADGVTQTDVVVLDVGRQAAAASKSVAMATEDKTVFDAINSILGASGDAASVSTTIKAALRAIATALGPTALDLGQGTGGSRTLRVAIDGAQLDGNEYETVAASQTAQTLGATGATGDYISGVLVIPETTSPGNVLLLDNATSITVFAGGATSVSNLVPFFIPLGMISVSGAWKLTTGTNVHCIGIGNFT